MRYFILFLTFLISLKFYSQEPVTADDLFLEARKIAFDEKEMLENPPEEILEIIKLETELARIEDQKKGLL